MNLLTTCTSFSGLIGAARRDITPPVGIYARNWGAARHETAQGIHRPLTLTCITFQSSASSPPLVLIAADLGWWRSREDEWRIRGSILESLSLDPSRLMFCLSHTHSGPALQSFNAHQPGGRFIAEFQHKLIASGIAAAREALASRQSATIDWIYGKCDLAANRDFADPAAQRFVCGFNPSGVGDDTLLVGRVSDADERTTAVIVNYACHPTTLAWENTLISPDYVGAMRETIETHLGCTSLFLQGASGELAPAEQYSGDVELADRHGRKLGLAVLSTLAGMNRPASRLAFRGVEESGAPLAVWRQTKVQPNSTLHARQIEVPLALKPMPAQAEIEKQWQECKDHVLRERLWRKLAIRKVVGDGDFAPIPLWVWRIGDAFLVGQPDEAYSDFQREIRAAFPDHPIALMNLVNGSAGYLPPDAMYDQNIYQVTQTPFARGSLEKLIETTRAAIGELA